MEYLNFETEVEVDLTMTTECSECGEELSADYTHRGGSDVDVAVSPCTTCMETYKNELKQELIDPEAEAIKGLVLSIQHNFEALLEVVKAKGDQDERDV